MFHSLNRYYLQAIASKQSGALKVFVNAKMFNTTLNGKISSRIVTEVQEIEISSVIVPETTVSSFDNILSNVFLTPIVSFRLFYMEILRLLMAHKKYKK